MRLIDANVVIRYLIDENTDQGARSLAFLARVATGEEQVMLPECVLTEIVHVLSSKALYDRPRAEISIRLGAVIELRGLTLHLKDAHLDALELYGQSSLDYEDCVSIAMLRLLGIHEIVSFDRDFDRFEDIARVEP